MNPTRPIDDYLRKLGEQQRRLAARGRALKTVNQMTPRQFNRRITAQMPVQVDELPLADRLLQMEKTKTLVNNRLDRLTPDQQMRSLPLIARDYQDFLRQSRMQEAADSIAQGQRMAAYGVPITAAAVAGGVGLANALQQPEPEVDEPLTLDDVAILGAYAQAMDPADAMPLDEVDLGDFPGRFSDAYRTTDIPPLQADEDWAEPDVYIDGGDVDVDGLMEMIQDSQDTPVVAEIADLLAEDEPMLDMSDPVAEQPAVPVAEASRDPYMTNAQRRTMQVFINAGIPSERAGRIARGQASLTQQEYDMVTGGRR